MWDGPYLAVEHVISSTVTLRCLSFARYGKGIKKDDPAYVNVPGKSKHTGADERWYGKNGHPCDVCDNVDGWPKYQTNSF